MYMYTGLSPSALHPTPCHCKRARKPLCLAFGEETKLLSHRHIIQNHGQICWSSYLLTTRIAYVQHWCYSNKCLLFFSISLCSAVFISIWVFVCWTYTNQVSICVMMKMRLFFCCIIIWCGTTRIDSPILFIFYHTVRLNEIVCLAKYRIIPNVIAIDSMLVFIFVSFDIMAISLHCVLFHDHNFVWKTNYTICSLP